MNLYATPLSHFSRKIRILLDLYAVPYEVIDIGNVAEGPIEKFGNNPLARVPVLVDGSDWMIESDSIAEYIVRKVDPEDRYRVLSRDVPTLNIRAVLNGIMDEEVMVIIARRTHVPTEQYTFFTDALETIQNGLAWLENYSDRFSVLTPGYPEFHLVCVWEHLAYYDLVSLNYEKLKKTVEQIAMLPTIQRSSPWVLKPKA